jgi:hypothetical protein
MRFSLFAAAASRDLFTPTAFRGSYATENYAPVYPSVYDASAAGPSVVPVPVTYVEQPSSDWTTPVVVVALAIAGYTIGKASMQSTTPQQPDSVAMLGLMGKSDKADRRDVLKLAGAALASFAAADAASAKAGEFSKIEIFSVVGTPGISSPYQPGGPKAGKDATFGYAKTEGEFVANGYELDVTREKAAYQISKQIVSSQLPNIESKTWWLVRDNLRGQAYNMKANMRAINTVLDPAVKKEADKSYAKFWTQINDLDFACKKKELALAKAEYAKCLDLLGEYEKVTFG